MKFPDSLGVLPLARLLMGFKNDETLIVKVLNLYPQASHTQFSFFNESFFPYIFALKNGSTLVCDLLLQAATAEMKHEFKKIMGKPKSSIHAAIKRKDYPTALSLVSSDSARCLEEGNLPIHLCLLIKEKNEAKKVLACYFNNMTEYVLIYIMLYRICYTL